MKKKHIVTVALILIILLIAVNIKPILNYASDRFWDFVVYQLNKEEEERHRRMENGEIVRGKDTILIWHNMYEIGHYADGNRLGIETGKISDNILEKVKQHKVVKKKLYIVSDEGYAVIDENNLCKVFITVDDTEFVNGYTEDAEGNHTYKSRKVECEYIEYLSEYDEFSSEEKHIFNKLLQKLQK